VFASSGIYKGRTSSSSQSVLHWYSFLLREPVFASTGPLHLPVLQQLIDSVLPSLTIELRRRLVQSFKCSFIHTAFRDTKYPNYLQIYEQLFDNSLATYGEL